MKCPNCGAEFSVDDAACPYCGADNFLKSKEKHDSLIRDIRQKEEDYRRLPDRAAKKGGKLVLFIVAGFVIIGLLAALIAYAGGRLSEKKKAAGYEKLAARLEILYAAGDYEQLAAEMQGIYGIPPSFGKYEHTRDLQKLYSYGCSELDAELTALQNQGRAEAFSGSIYFLRGLYLCGQYEAEGYVYGEEAAVLYYRKLYTDTLREKLLLTDEELEAFLMRYADIQTEQDNRSDYTYRDAENDRDALAQEIYRAVSARLIPKE